MYNATRRNRNIGTTKQGFKKRNRFDIPCYYLHEDKIYWEKLTDYKKIERQINGWKFTFIVEKTKKNYFHACTIEDLETILQHIPSAYFHDLRTIILRQPKRTERIFSSVWGRLVFYYEFEDKGFPAIILESVKSGSRFRYSRKADIDTQKELERLRNDGFEFIENKRDYEINLELENVRNTQLYRTLLHEIGHYVQYCEDEEKFDQLPTAEKEVFAHNFADNLKLELEQKGLIPFPRQFFEQSFEQNGLDKNDFLEND
jgi:predicted SprT family Zn-dependent metalloprotease